MGDQLSYISDAGYGFPSATNSTTAPLLSTGTFVGAAEQNPSPDVLVSCYSDVAGTLFFDFSMTGTDWQTYPINGFSVAAGAHELRTTVKGPRYFRVRYVNGASDQTSLQLFTYYGTYKQPASPLNQPYSTDSDSVLTRQSLAWLDIARGLATGLQTVQKFGRNSAVGTAYVPVCFGGVYQTPQASGATAVRIAAGGNANDTAAGTGAREILIEGLDQNFNYATETIATNGASASASTATTFSRIYRATVSKSGAYANATTGSHAGTITIENSGGGTTWLVIDATNFPKGASEVGAYTIAAGKTGFVKLRNVSIDSGKTVDLIFFSRSGVDETAPPYSPMRAQSVVHGVSGGSIETFGSTEIPFGPYIGPTDIGFMAKVSSGSASVSVEFEIFIIDEQ